VADSRDPFEPRPIEIEVEPTLAGHGQFFNECFQLTNLVGFELGIRLRQIHENLLAAMHRLAARFWRGGFANRHFLLACAQDRVADTVDVLPVKIAYEAEVVPKLGAMGCELIHARDATPRATRAPVLSKSVASVASPWRSEARKITGLAGVLAVSAD
jgi:hypothetical protein